MKQFPSRLGDPVQLSVELEPVQVRVAQGSGGRVVDYTVEAVRRVALD